MKVYRYDKQDHKFYQFNVDNLKVGDKIMVSNEKNNTMEPAIVVTQPLPDSMLLYINVGIVFTDLDFKASYTVDDVIYLSQEYKRKVA